MAKKKCKAGGGRAQLISGNKDVIKEAEEGTTGDKDTVKFPFKKPVDWELVERLVAFLVTSEAHSGAEPEGDPQA